MITLDIDDKEVVSALSRLRDKVGETGLQPALAAIGERLTETTKQRFASSTAPDGSRWAPNAESTLLALMRGKSKGGLRTKGGSTKASPLRAALNKRPLVATKQLARTIRHQLIPGGVAVGTDRFAAADKFDGGAAVHQFGSKNGRIPARPFLGLSDGDRTAVLAILTRHLAGE